MSALSSPQDGTPEAPPEKGTTRAVLWRADNERCEELPVDQISQALISPGSLFWVDMENPGPADFEFLRDTFDFHRLALEDATQEVQRPKVQEYPDYFFIVIYAPVLIGPEKELRTTEVDLFVGHNYLVSLHSQPIPTLREAIQRWEEHDLDLRHHVGLLVHAILDTIIDSYFPIVDEVEDRLDELELSMFLPKMVSGPEDLLAIKRSLFALRKAIYPLRDVFNALLRRDHALFGPETFPYFQDVYDHVLRLLDTVDIQRDMVTGNLDAYLAVVSNRLNETVKTLTVAGICIATAGSVFGAWGMNVDYIPLAHQHIGHTSISFALVTGLALGLIALALAWARRKSLW